MNCGVCGTKCIVISTDSVVAIFCPNCHPELDRAIMKGKRE